MKKKKKKFRKKYFKKKSKKVSLKRKRKKILRKRRKKKKNKKIKSKKRRIKSKTKTRKAVLNLLKINEKLRSYFRFNRSEQFLSTRSKARGLEGSCLHITHLVPFQQNFHRF